MSEVAVEHDESENIFFIDRDGARIGELNYSRPDDDTLSFDRTWVDPEQRGQQLAGKLVDQGIEYAREHGRKVIPKCSYVHARIEKRRELRDVLPESYEL